MTDVPAPEPSEERVTATLAGAREHARQQAAGAVQTGPTMPATSAVGLPADVSADHVIWDETIPAGGYGARRLPRGAVLSLTDVAGDGCLAILAYRADNPMERLNVADTVKVQWQAYLGPGALLLSDMGRVLLTLVADSSARHDCLAGTTNRAANDRRYGSGIVSGPTPNGRDLLALGAAKVGLTRADVVPNVNLFKGVRVSDDGSLAFEGSVRPGTHVRLRCELDVLVVLANVPHPLDDRAGYLVTPVRATAWTGPAPDPDDDPLWLTTPERQRAFQNTDALLAESGR